MSYGFLYTLTGCAEVLAVVLYNWFNVMDMYALIYVEATFDWPQVTALGLSGKRPVAKRALACLKVEPGGDFFLLIPWTDDFLTWLRVMPRCALIYNFSLRNFLRNTWSKSYAEDIYFAGDHEAKRVSIEAVAS